MPNYVSSWVSLHYGRLEALDQTTLAALELTAEALHAEVVNAGVMPFDTGNMQNAQTYVDNTDLPNGNVSLVTGSPQARRLIGEGKRVLVARSAPEKLRCRAVIDLTEGGASHG